MPALQLTLTTAGLDALVDAQSGATDPISITELGLANAAFTAAPTLEALPNEFKRIDSVAGVAAAENIIHMVAQDSSADIYSVYGVGLFLADGTLFATYAQPDPIVVKVSIASFLIAFDVAFFDAVDAAIEFGDASFLYPPATETTKGVAELATEAEADAGVDAQRIMPPNLVKRVVDAAAATLNAAITAIDTAQTAARTAAVTAINASIATLTGRTITGTGLATGGGDLTANRTIGVEAASAAELQAAVIANKAVTPASFGGLTRVHGATGYEIFPGGTLVQRGMYRSGITGQTTVTITLPIAFADADYDLQLTTAIPGADNYDNFVQELGTGRAAGSFTVWSQDTTGEGFGNISGFNWRVEGRA